MVKYTIAMLYAMVGAKTTVPIDNIYEHPTLRTLWHLQQKLVDGLYRVGNVKSLLENHAGYILPKEDFTLFSIKERKYPKEVGEYYGIPVTVITITTDRRKHVEGQKKKSETFKNRKMVLMKMFEEIVDPDFHSDSRVLATKGFGTAPPVYIMENIQRLYGKPSYQDIDAALLRLNDLMKIMQLIEVMLRGIE